jgi:hypothetical protein
MNIKLIKQIEKEVSETRAEVMCRIVSLRGSKHFPKDLRKQEAVLKETFKLFTDRLILGISPWASREMYSAINKKEEGK